MGDVYPKVKLAAAQAAPVWLNREATVQKACSLIEEAGRNGAQIVAFPEGYLPGFPDWFNWYMPRSPESIRFSKELIKNAIEVPSPATDELCAAARRAGVYVVMGMNERDPGTMGSLFNALLFISPEGEILGVHRKIVPTSTERLIHWFGDGTSLRTYETPYGALGGLICGENTNSLARFALLAQHDLRLATGPSPVPPPRAPPWARAHACPVRGPATALPTIATCGTLLSIPADSNAAVTASFVRSLRPRSLYLAKRVMPAPTTTTFLIALSLRQPFSWVEASPVRATFPWQAYPTINVWRSV